MRLIFRVLSMSILLLAVNMAARANEVTLYYEWDAENQNGLTFIEERQGVDSFNIPNFIQTAVNGSGDPPRQFVSSALQLKLTPNVNTQKSNIDLKSIPPKTVTLKLQNRPLQTINLMFHLNTLDFRYQPSTENNLKNINYEESFCEGVTDTEPYLGVIEKRYLINLKNGNNCKFEINDLNQSDQIAIGFAYQIFLNNNNLLKIHSGRYEGEVSYSIDNIVNTHSNFSKNIDHFTIKFVLNVKHHLKVHLTGHSKVQLEPCAQAGNCRAATINQNWQNWHQNRYPLTGKTRFSLSSSGPFKVYLECEYESQSGCAIESKKNQTLVPVQTRLVLPDFAVPENKLLQTKNHVDDIIFPPDVNNQQGDINFSVTSDNVETMLKNAPDTYSGRVTVVFDTEFN